MKIYIVVYNDISDGFSKVQLSAHETVDGARGEFKRIAESIKAETADNPDWVCEETDNGADDVSYNGYEDGYASLESASVYIVAKEARP